MFRLFNDLFKSYSLAAIKNGEHLEQAKDADCGDFFAKKNFKKGTAWDILYVHLDAIYWGKVEAREVQHKLFFKTSKKEIEAEFSIMDEANDYPALSIIKKYIKADMELIDGVRYELLSAKYDTLTIQEDGNFFFMIMAEVNQHPVLAEPKPALQMTIPYQVLVDSHDFAMLKVRMR